MRLGSLKSFYQMLKMLIMLSRSLSALVNSENHSFLLSVCIAHTSRSDRQKVSGTNMTPRWCRQPQTTTKQIGAPDWAVVAWEIWNYDNLPPKPGPMPLLEGDQLRHGYLASISFADSLVGQVLEKVSALGLDDNTVVVIWSDHGYKLGDHGGWGETFNCRA